LVFVAGRLTAAEEEAAGPRAVPPPVTALRYNIFFVEFTLEMIRGGGRWGQELYFPERGIVCNLTHETGDILEEGIKLHPKVNAFENTIRNRYSLRPGQEEITAATEEVEIPAEVAERIFAFAELSKRQREESERLGGALEEVGLLNLIDDNLKKLRKLELEAEK